MNRAATQSQGWFDISLFVIALLIALGVGRLVIKNADEGINRWQTDVANGSIQLNLPVEDRLMVQWCSRDREQIQNWFGERESTLCPLKKTSLWSKIIKDAESQTSVEKTLNRWQLELLEREKQWRRQLFTNSASDVSATVLSELLTSENKTGDTKNQLILERQAADDWLQKQEVNRDRLQQWEAWERSVLLPALQAPLHESSAHMLVNAARSLDGVGTDFAAQLVRRHLGVNDNRNRASQLIAMTVQLPAVLFTHWCLTLVLVLILRWHRPVSHKVTAGLALALVTWVVLYSLGCASNPLQASYWLIAGCVALGTSWCWHTFFPHRQTAPQSILPFSKWVLPAWWLFSALGWLLIFDQSLHFHNKNRFLALEQWQAWWLASWILPIAAMSGNAVSKVLLWLGAQWFQPSEWKRQFWQLPAGILFVGVTYLAHRLHVHQHITGELLKLGFIISIAAWCVWRMPVVSELWNGGMRLQALRQALPSLWLFALAAGISFVTRDKGPLLVIAMLMVVLFSALVGWTTGLAMLGIGFLMIFLIGVDLDVVGSRLQAWRDPFTADHDDMARLMWFQSAAAEDLWGFGPGQTPWCGTVSLDQCRGLPLQLQSDYTFTAVVGWWGLAGSLLMLFAFTLFGFHLMVHGARTSQRFMNPIAFFNSQLRNKAMHGHLLFFTGLLILLQTWITVAGNTGWLPLTGLTWPLISYGKTSLWISTWLICSWGFGADDA